MSGFFIFKQLSNMKIVAPKNIYSSIFLSALATSAELEINFKESALIAKELESNTSSIGIIPTLDLLKNQHLFVSSKAAISFDGILSNSYLYFAGSQIKPEKVFLRGDISLNEIILSKILFSERFSSQVEVSLDASALPEIGRNYIIVGDDNHNHWDTEKGLSLSDQIAEMLDLPYVNFTFASRDKEILAEFNKLMDGIDNRIDEQIDSYIENLNYTEKTKSFIKNNLSSVYFEMTENEIIAVNELVKLIYYHGIVDDMFDVKFV